MKAYTTDALRNVGLFSHGGAGKTSLVEAMLFQSKAVTRLGRIEEGNTTTDFDPDEIKRHMSVQLALAPCEWNGCKINLVDPPGYAEFVGEVKAAMRVVDAALILLDAVGGVEVGALQAWQYADQAGTPARVLFVNKMDRENANFGHVLNQAAERLSKGVAPLQIPVGSETNFRGVVDLLKMKAYIYDAQKGDGKFSEQPIPADLQAEATRFRDLLIERVAEVDDDLTMKYLEGEELTEEELRRGLLQGVRSGALVPAFCGSATCNIGVSQLLDALTTIVPSPADLGPVALTRPGTDEAQEFAPSPNSPLAALVFKTQVDRFGTLSLFRVYTGTLHADSQVLNSTRNREERIGQVYLLKGKEQTPTQEVVAGDMGAVVKLADTHTGDTLCAPGQPWTLPGIEFPAPVFSAAVTPKSKADLDKLGTALNTLLVEDPTLQVSRDPATGEQILSGMGENHVQIVAERMQRKSGVSVDIGLPRVPYRETITRKVPHILYRHKKQTGGHGQFAEVVIEIEPLPEGDFEFGERVVGGSVPRNFFPAVEKGVREQLGEGILAGYPVVHVRVVLYDGKFHPVDSSEMAFKTAAAMAFKEGFLQGNPVLLEPIMLLHITVPDAFGGDVLSDLNGKRARTLGLNPQGNGLTQIDAYAPLSEVQRYVSDLRSITQGQGTFTMEFDRYEQVPAHLMAGIVEASRAAHAEKAAAHAH
jgi:elongation factor G